MCSRMKCWDCHTSISSYDLIKCVRCHTKLHYMCYTNNYENLDKGYTQCPQCLKIGTMGVTQKVIDKINSKCSYMCNKKGVSITQKK